VRERIEREERGRYWRVSKRKDRDLVLRTSQKKKKEIILRKGKKKKLNPKLLNLPRVDLFFVVW
jgi:hypothetical protein